MSLRQKYLKILTGIAPAGALGVSLMLGSTTPAAADPEPIEAQPQARVAERLAAIRDAASTVAAQQAAEKSVDDMRLAWGNWWRNWGRGRPWGGWGWPNWNNWRNWNNWPNWWRNW